MSAAAATSMTRRMTVTATAITTEDYVMLSPDGRVLKVTAAIYEALAMFMGMNRKHESGAIELQFRNGGVAGVEAKVKLK